MVNKKKFPKVFFTHSENEYKNAAFSVTPCIMILSVGEPPTAGFLVELSSSSDISSRSKVPVEVAKPWPCSKEVHSLVYLLFSFPSLPHPARSSSRAGFGWISVSNFLFVFSGFLTPCFNPLSFFQPLPSLLGPFYKRIHH